jgi:hypothetical protein
MVDVSYTTHCAYSSNNRQNIADVLCLILKDYVNPARRQIKVHQYNPLAGIGLQGIYLTDAAQ